MVNFFLLLFFLRKMESKSFICVLCKRPRRGYGNNAQPVKFGKCCDVCNHCHVIPARAALMFGRGARDMVPWILEIPGAADRAKGEQPLERF